MAYNKIFYKINSEDIKKFPLNDAKGFENFFIISDLSKINISEIINLLNNNRKVVIDDNAIVSFEKIVIIFKNLASIENQKYLFISKEAYLKMWFHQEYSKLLNTLEIIGENNSNWVVESDIPLQTGIKFKYFEKQEYLLKILENSLYTKNTFSKIFDGIEFNVQQEYQKMLKFYKLIKNNLIPSSSIFIEHIAKKFNVVCNVLNSKNDFHPEIKNMKRNGIVSCIDTDNNLIANLSNQEKKLLPQYVLQNHSNFGWLDLVKTKTKIKSQNISEIFLENIEWLSHFEEIKVCSEYGFNFMRTKSIPNISQVDKVLPLYTKFDGWNKPVAKLNNENDVPIEMMYFIHELKHILEVSRIVVRLRYLKIEV
ncbi:MAG: adenylosuccinate synthetase [Malacoplasma sp.]|nr:adenylosuccinate synthetase [Malacoplasma sp.]